MPACVPFQESGKRERTRVVTVTPKNGGAACPVLAQYQDCAVDCEVSDWTDWGECNMQTGVKIRERGVLIGTQNGGLPCPNLQVLYTCCRETLCVVRMHGKRWYQEL